MLHFVKYLLSLIFGHVRYRDVRVFVPDRFLFNKSYGKLCYPNVMHSVLMLKNRNFLCINLRVLESDPIRLGFYS